MLLCKKISQVEWSGLIFYNIEGEIWDDPIINVVDIHPIHKGTSGSTSLKGIASTLNNIYDEKEHLEDCLYGSIHSHNNMNVFFSDTDMNDLFQDVDIYNPFVSLITNNQDKYVAKLSFLTKSDVSNYHTNQHINQIKQIFYYDIDVVVEKDLPDLNTYIQDMINNGVDLNDMYNWEHLEDELEVIPEVKDQVFLTKLNEINKPKPSKQYSWWGKSYTDSFEWTNYKQDFDEWEVRGNDDVTKAAKVIKEINKLFNHKGDNLMDHLRTVPLKKINKQKFEAHVNTYCKKYSYAIMMFVFEHYCNTDVAMDTMTETQNYFINTLYECINRMYTDDDKLPF